MTDKDTRALLERACAKAVDVMLSGDDVATVRQGTGHHVVTIRTVESEEREARTIQRRVEHAENVRADTERELSRVADELAHVRETGAAELARASDALASAAAEVDARAEVARQTGIAVDHCARADAAERMVAELRVAAEGVVHDLDVDGTVDRDEDCVEMLQHALASTAEVAGRWVSKADFDGLLKQSAAECMRIAAERIAAERDAALAARDEAEDELGCIKEAITQHLPCYVDENDEDDELDAVDTIEEAGRELAHLKATVGSHVSAGTYAKRVDERDAARAALAAAVAARDEAVAKLDAIRMSHDRVAEALAAAERARDEALAESAQWREALTTIIRELDDENGCMGIDCEPLSAKEVSAQDVATAITKRAHELQGWVRRYIMGEPMRGDATSEEEHARAQVMTLICDRDNAIRARDEVGIQLVAANAEIARMRPVVEAARDVRDEHMTDEPVMGRVMDRLIEAFRALDAVPGDALAPTFTAALEASGIDSANVKGVE